MPPAISPTIDIFGIIVLVLGLTALGLSVVFEASRISAAAGKAALIRRRIQAREREQADQRLRLTTAETDAEERRRTLDGLLAERGRVIAATTALRLSKIEMVHEIGDADGSPAIFVGELRHDPATVRPDQRRTVFAREIWEHNNVAQIWAATPDTALAAVRRAFTDRTGVGILRVQRGLPPHAAPNRPDDAGTPRSGDAADPAPENAAGAKPDRPPLRMASTPRVA